MYRLREQSPPSVSAKPHLKLEKSPKPKKMCTTSDQSLPGGSMGSDLSIALPIALPNAKGELVERNYQSQEWGYEGAIGGGGWISYWAIQSW